MFYVYTQNRFNQILIFNTYEDARQWLKTCTRFTDAEIAQAIKTPRPAYDGATFCEIFQ